MKLFHCIEYKNGHKIEWYEMATTEEIKRLSKAKHDLYGYSTKYSFVVWESTPYCV